MIAIVCPGAPEKGMTTKLTPLGPNEWEVEVFQTLPFVGEIRIPELDRAVDLAGALDVLWDAENGAADELAQALGLSSATIATAWERHHARAAIAKSPVGAAALADAIATVEKRFPNMGKPRASDKDAPCAPDIGQAGDPASASASAPQASCTGAQAGNEPMIEHALDEAVAHCQRDRLAP